MEGQNRLRGLRPLRGGGTPFGQKHTNAPELPGALVCFRRRRASEAARYSGEQE
jgi:hypothetical protein